MHHSSRTIAALFVLALLARPVFAHVGQHSPTIIGPTGGFLAPNPLTLPPEKTAVAVHLEGLNVFSENTLDVEPAYALSSKVLVGVYDYLELGLERQFRLHTSQGDDSIYANAKYRFPFDSFNLAVGIVAPLTPPDWTSAYLVAGWKALWVGFGTNFNGRRFRELTLDSFRNVGVSRLGGYSLRRELRNGNDEFSGEPDAFFGLVGFNHRLSDNLRIIADYNGDRVAAGARVEFHDWNVDVLYVTQSAIDELFSRETQNWMIGIGGRF